MSEWGTDGGEPLSCETCGNAIVEDCFVSIGPAVVIFCFECAGYHGPPKIRADRIICAAP